MQRVSTGSEVTDDVLRLNPELPPELHRLDMRVRFRGRSLVGGSARVFPLEGVAG